MLSRDLRFGLLKARDCPRPIMEAENSSCSFTHYDMSVAIVGASSEALSGLVKRHGLRRDFRSISWLSKTNFIADNTDTNGGFTIPYMTRGVPEARSFEP